MICRGIWGWKSAAHYEIESGRKANAGSPFRENAKLISASFAYLGRRARVYAKRLNASTTCATRPWPVAGCGDRAIRRLTAIASGEFIDAWSCDCRHFKRPKFVLG